MTTSTFRPSVAVALRRLVLAAAIGAGLGVLFYFDQQLIGGYEAQARIADFQPVKGFWWHVSGGAVLAIALLIFAAVLYRPWRRPWRDRAHETYCLRYYDRRGRCSCPYEAQNWTPEQRRAAWRTIQGGRP